MIKKSNNTRLKKLSEEDLETATTMLDLNGPKSKAPVLHGPVTQDAYVRVNKDGSKHYYDSFGKLHRTDGPSVISSDGNQLWYQHGKLHRQDGPAATFFNGTTKWFMGGEEIPLVNVLQIMLKRGRISVHDIDTLKELAEIAFLDYLTVEPRAIAHATTLLLEKGIISSRNPRTVIEFLKAASKL